MPEATALQGAEDMGWYDRAGPVTGRPVVLVHPSELSRKVWLQQMSALQDEFRVLAPDLPGHGVLRDEPFTFESAMARLRRVIDEEAGGRAVLVGLSLGGYAAMALAGAAPDQIRGLVLSGCSWRLRGVLGLGLRAYGWATERLSARLFPLLSTLEFRLLRRGTTPRAVLKAGLTRSSISHALAALARNDPFAGLSEYRGPVLLLNGARDLVFRQDERELLSRLHRGRLEVIRRAGHLANLDQPEGFSEAVRGFCRSMSEAAWPTT